LKASLLLRLAEWLFPFGDVWPFRSHVGVELNVVGPLFWEVIFVEDRLDWTLGDACFAIDALIGMNHEDRFSLVKTFDGANDHAIGVFAVETGFSNDVGHQIILRSENVQRVG